MSKTEIKLSIKQNNVLNESLENSKSTLVTTFHDIHFLFRSMPTNAPQFDQELVNILLKFETETIKNMTQYVMKAMEE